ncbi:MAG: EamA family transporter [Chloroflexota bacterium]|nr:EamA family transporter [Chloroflexota bacterium]
MRRRRDISTQFIGYLMVMTASLLFGFNGNLSRLLFDGGITPITLVQFRMLIGGGCLLGVLLAGQRKALIVSRRHWGWLVAFGLTLALVTYTYFVAISLLPIAIALVIQFSAAAWMALGEAIWRRRLPSRYVLSALLCTFGGIVLLTGIWRLSFNGLNLVGLLYALLSLVAYVAYLLLGRRAGRDLPSLSTTTYGALVATVFWFCVQPPWTVPASTWVPRNFLLICIVGIFGMAIPFSLMLGSLRRIDATRVGIAGMLELVAAGVIAYFWLGQHLDLSQIVGCLLVLVGLTVLQYEKPEPLEPL